MTTAAASDPTEHRLLDALGAGRERTIERLRELVRIASVSGDEAPAQRLVESWLEPAADEVDVWCPQAADLAEHPAARSVSLDDLGERPNIVARFRGAGGGRSQILNGHVDIVPPGPEAAWPEPPFGAVLRDGWVHGRGAADMKAGLVTIVAAVEAVREAGTAGGDVLVQSVIGEETGGTGTLAACLRGYRADAAVIPEPSGLEVWPAQAGCFRFRIRLQGHAAHAGLRDDGVNTIEKFVPVLWALERLEAEHNATLSHPLYDGGDNKVPLQIGRLEAGNWWSMVPDALVAEGRYGTFVGEVPAEACAALEAAVADTACADPWLRQHPPEVDWLAQVEAAGIEADAPIVQAMADAVSSVRGTATVRGCTAGSGARTFINSFGIPALLCGPGSLAVAHLPGERLQVDELIDAARALALLIHRSTRD